VFNPLDLTGKRILVTGASGGLGRATAGVLARLGARLVVTGRREDALRDTLDATGNPEAHAASRFDLGDVDGVPAWMKGIAADGALHGVVHAAGLSTAIPIKVLSRARIDGLMLPNVYAALALLRGVSQKGVGAEGCSVVLVSSVSGITGAPGHATYSASKGALHSLVRSAALELAPKRMRVNCVAPAWVEGPITEVVEELRGSGEFDKTRERQFLGTVPPEDVGVSAAYLLSDAARRVTGTTMVIDGGWSC
jgi:NAD(P)-dependent dehydrogenase (short-subunit alcohol dehydrogenase family)